MHNYFISKSICLNFTLFQIYKPYHSRIPPYPIPPVQNPHTSVAILFGDVSKSSKNVIADITH